MRRAVLAIVIGVGAVLLSASPAAADPARPTNVGSHVSAVTPPTAAVTVDLLGANAFLRIRVEPGTAVTVMGYEGEPYLRIGTDGAVEANRNSKATYLNRTLTGRVDIPPTASATAADAPPVRCGGGGEYAWHDHRVHWMAAGVPPERQDWQVPLLVDGAPATVTGWYAAQSAPSPLAWWLVTLAVAAGCGAGVAAVVVGVRAVLRPVSPSAVPHPG